MSMMKKMSQQAFVYMLFQGVGFCVSLISFPIMIRVFSVQEYGDLALINATIAILLALAKCGLTTSFVRHYATYKSTKNLQLLFTTAISGSILVSLTIVLAYTLIVLLLKATMESYLVKIFLVAGLVILIRNLNNLFSAFFRAEERVMALNVLSLIYRIGSIATGLLICVFLLKGIYGYLIGVILFEGSMVLFIGITFYKEAVGGIKSTSKELLYKLYFYGFPLVFFETSSLIHDSSDRFLIKYFLDSTQVGIYSVGYNFSAYVQGLITAPLWMAVFPIYTKLWESSGKEATEAFLSRLLKYYLIVSVFLIFLVSGLSKELITILATEKYLSSADLIPFIISGVMVSGTYHIIGAGYFLTSQTRKIALYALICAGVNILLNLYFVPAYGILGAAFTAVISYVLLTLLITINARKILTIRWPFLDVLYYLIFAGVMMMTLRIIHIDNRLIDVACKLMAGTLIYTLCILAYDKDARKTVCQLLPFNRT